MSPLLLAIAAMGQGARRVFLLVSPATGEVLTWTISSRHARRLRSEAHRDDPMGLAVICRLEVL